MRKSRGWDTILALGLLMLHVCVCQGKRVPPSWIDMGRQPPELFQVSQQSSSRSSALPGSGPGGGSMCGSIRGLSKRQLKVCQLFPDHMGVVSGGARLAIGECAWQFRGSRWNCSTVDDGSVFGALLAVGSRETAFTYAITSAAVVHTVARACHDGHLTSCGCSRHGRPRGLRSNWVWGGCSDNMDYGYRFSHQFVDGREARSLRKTARGLMNVHNNRAGRRAILWKARIACKCHGVSGSCTVMSCWKQLAPFREIGDFLKDKYDGATEVRVGAGGRLETRDPRFNPLTANDVVYMDDSPSYCVRDMAVGSLGTHGRQCNRSSHGMDGCNLLCCGRGYNSHKAVVRERCDCKFHWCCYVQCKVCANTVDVHTCK